jgi:hypothetical protein
MREVDRSKSEGLDAPSIVFALILALADVIRGEPDDFISSC